jgi:hypothetical protein
MGKVVNGLLKVEIDTRQFDAAMRDFPKETKKTLRQLLNDEAFEFKAVAPGIIDKHMKVRNKGFVSRAFRVEKAKPSGSVDQMVAVAGSVTIEPSSSHGGFSGWAEQEGEPSPAFMKKRAMRSIGKNARRGSMGALPRKKARLAPGIIVDTDDLFGPTMPTEASRAQVAMLIAAANKEKCEGDGRVILRGGGWTPGLYGIKKIINRPAKKRAPKGKGRKFIKVGILQEFDEDTKVKPVPWVEETSAEVKKKFTQDYIAKHYLAPIFLGLVKK